MNVGYKVKSPSNIALIKYWGRQNEEKILPSNVSFSFNLSDCFTISEFVYGDFAKDSYIFKDKENENALAYMTFLRKYFMSRGVLIPFVKVISENNFEDSAGLASSASAFSALCYGMYALAVKFGHKFDRNEMIELTRMSGSASAVRSLGDFFVTYDPEEGLHELGEFDLVDVVAVVDDEAKSLSSFEGHIRALSSNWFDERQKNVFGRFEKILLYLRDSDYDNAFDLIEEETWSFLLNHYSSEPPMQYLTSKSLDLVRQIKEFGIKCAYTFDAGSTVHFICRSCDMNKVKGLIEKDCLKVYVNKPTIGTHLIK